MAPQKSLPAPEGFVPLGPNSSLYTPSTTNTTTSITSTRNPTNAQMNAPTLVIFCSWMGAAPKNITKYTTTYQALLPNASILLVQSAILDMTWKSFAAQNQSLLPAIDFTSSFLSDAATAAGLENASAFTAKTSPVVLHIFSHGGSNSILRLLRGLQSKTRSMAPLPLRAFILDSTPGDDSYARAAAAATVGLPRSGPLHWLGLLAIHFTLLVRFTLMWVGLTRGIKHLRAALVDEGLFGRETPRLYCYSEGDRMVDWRAVEAHAAEARSRGYVVEERSFGGSPHCGHIREDEGKYWGAVKGVLGLE